MKMITKSTFLVILVLGLLVSACGEKTEKETDVPIEDATPMQTATPSEPTPTAVPLALEVNGDGIYLSDFNDEISRFGAALSETGQTLSEDEQKQTIIDNFINELLLAQAARENGFEADEQTIQNHLDQLVSELGNGQLLVDWQSQNFYDDASLNRALKRSVEAAWQRDQIISSVPETAEQINGRQILLENEVYAQQVYQQLSGGVDFENLAFQYDTLTGGYLGWFPRGYLTQPELDEAVFALESGQFTNVVATSLGYHIIYVIERDPQHTLSANALEFVRHQTLENWLQDRRSNSQINILVE